MCEYEGGWSVNPGTVAVTDGRGTWAATVPRTLSDLTPEERHVLRAVALFDSFDLDLATRAAGFARQAPALRLGFAPRRCRGRTSPERISRLRTCSRSYSTAPI